MNCPQCGHKTKTLDTRKFLEPDGSFPWVRRRHKCTQCHQITQTVEIPQETWNKACSYEKTNSIAPT
jgi:transcriptional regulator NrdR family protein